MLCEFIVKFFGHFYTLKSNENLNDSFGELAIENVFFYEG